jgi:phosphohistidine phosphatase
MQILLVRHGEAESEFVDPAQPLRARGKLEVARVARRAAAAGVTVAEIRHSSKLRAKQTAEILAEHLRPVRGLHEVSYLEPMAAPEAACEAAESAVEPLLLVGHLPHLGRLTSLLLAGDSHRQIVRLAPGTLVRFERVERDWLLNLLLPPAILGTDADS